MKPLCQRFGLWGFLFVINFQFVGFTQFLPSGERAVSEITWHSKFGGTTNDLYGVYFLNDSVGWVAGDNGTIIKTTDGGENWQIKSSGTTHNLSALFFIDDNTGWAVGDLGTILKTTNGGDTWFPQNSASIFLLLSVQFFNDSLGWTVGTGGLILKTMDGGNSWFPQNSSFPEGITDVDFVDSLYGWAAASASGATASTVLKTTDGGSNWQVLTLPTFWPVNSVDFIDRNTGWAVGFLEVIYKTTDGGSTWFQQPGVSTIPESFYSVCFVDSNNGWAAGYGGVIAGTDDGGATWAAQTSGTTNILWDVYFVDPTHGWAVGNHGLVLKAVSTVSSIQENPGTPDGFILNSNFPNPFNSSTRITYTLPNQSEVVLRVYDISGREIQTLIKGAQSAGFKKITWNGSDSFNRPVSSGVYIIRLETDTKVMSQKMMLIR